MTEIVLKEILIITSPFTQLNTPYPASAYIKDFLNTKGISAFQMDLGIEVILELFSKQGYKIPTFAGIEVKEFTKKKRQEKLNYIPKIKLLIINCLQNKVGKLKRKLSQIRTGETRFFHPCFHFWTTHK